MVFSSFVFLLVFLPVILFIYYIAQEKYRNLVLFIASLIFYAWGEPKYVLIMLFSTVFDYTNGRLIAWFKKKDQRSKAKIVLIIDLCGNLGILGFFKYTDFLIGSINSITGAGLSLLQIALPIGISFYTFQTMSYTIDVYKGVVPAQKNILDFGTYVVLFPQLIAGPIVQYKTIAEELKTRTVTSYNFGNGAYRFTVGLAKKVLLANQAGALWDTISATGNLSTASAWLGAIAYTFQIYFDFSGYSDMAIGLGEMFGFHFLENFNHPYMANSITDFWRRWHISLSSWFREYVYIPLGGNRNGIKIQLRNICIVWLLTGLWHGASWNFVLWGVYYGILLVIEKLYLLKELEKSPSWFRRIYSLLLVVIGWTIFAQTDLSQLWIFIKAMFGVGVDTINSDFFYYVSSNAVVFVLLIFFSIDHEGWMQKFSWSSWLWSVIDCLDRNKIQIEQKRITFLRIGVKDLCRAVIMILLLVLSFAFLVGDSYNPFLYFRF